MPSVTKYIYQSVTLGKSAYKSRNPVLLNKHLKGLQQCVKLHKFWAFESRPKSSSLKLSDDESRRIRGWELKLSELAAFRHGSRLSSGGSQRDIYLS